MNEHEKKLDDFIDSYWNYFLELESEFASTQKYVAFDMCNRDTYSIEFLKERLSNVRTSHKEYLSWPLGYDETTALQNIMVIFTVDIPISSGGHR